MASVSRKEGFRYGFYMFAYWLALVAFGGTLVAAGGWVVSEQVGAIGLDREGGLAVLGGFVAVVGALVLGSGHAGLVYKLVADGVAAGADSASGQRSEPTARSVETTAPQDAPSDDSPVVRAGEEAESTGQSTTESGEQRPDVAADAGTSDEATTGQVETAETDDTGRSGAGEGTGDPVEGGSESPADVASESGIAAELGFEQDRTGRGTDDTPRTSKTDEASADSRSAGGDSDEPTGNDDPMSEWTTGDEHRRESDADEDA